MTSSSDTPSILIKKYANRRLYNTETSSYITQEHLAAMVRENREFKVVDAKSGEDLTRAVLTQIVVEEESRGQTLLPISFLRQLIAMYGDNLQSMVPRYLETAMETFRHNQEQVRRAMQGAISATPFVAPFEHLAKQNIAMFKAAQQLLTGEEATPAPAPTSPADDVADLRAQLAAMQARLDKLSS